MERASILRPRTEPVDLVYELLLKCGERTRGQLAQALNLPPTTVRYALKKLHERGDVQLSRPLRLPARPVRVVPSRVPETIALRAAERLEKARLVQSRVHLRQEQMRRRREELQSL